MGYTNQYKILNSIDFGIPQKRERVFCISILKNSGYTFNFDNLESIKTQPLNNFLEKDVDKKYFITQKSMIKAKVPIKICKNYIVYPRKKDGKLISGSYNRVWKNNRPIGTITSTNVTKILIDKKHDDLPIFIIDGKSYNFRVITERECWRLMGFEDKDYDKIQHIPKTYQYLLAGNSIVVQVLEAIFKELLKVGKNETTKNI